MPAFAIDRYFVIWGESVGPPWCALILRCARILRCALILPVSSRHRSEETLKLFLDFCLSPAHGPPQPGRRIGAMVSLIDDSQATTPRSWRTAVTSCQRPRNAGSASTPTQSTGTKNDGAERAERSETLPAGSQCHTRRPADVSTP